MDSYYEEIGKRALERFRSSVADASAIQKKLLMDLLAENAETEFGRRMGFGSISGPEEYARTVPASSYDDYAEAIEREMDGKRNVLTKEPPVYFCISSGSTAEPKYLPLTERDIMTHGLYAYAAVFGMIGEFYGWRDGKIFPKILQIGEFVRTGLQDGTMTGVRSSSLYHWLDRNGEFDCSDYCQPKEVLFPERLEDMSYVRARFALAEPGIRMISGIFVNGVVSFAEYIIENWQMLLGDMRTGTVSPESGAGQEWTEFLVSRLEPDPKRADELGMLDEGSLREGLFRKIWPELLSITCIEGDAFRACTERLETYAEGVPVYPFAYASSEGIFAIAPGLGRKDEYVLLPEAGYFEFIPEGGREEDALTADSLETGGRYELVVTNFSGLYRYRMEDILQVTGFYGESPVLRFCYRKNQILSVADEHTDTGQFESAVRSYCRKTGVPYSDNHCVYADFSVNPPRYCVCMETDEHHPEDGGAIFDAFLCQENFGYRGCRSTGDIGCARIVQIPEESFRKRMKSLLDKGRSPNQAKPLRVLKERGELCMTEN